MARSTKLPMDSLPDLPDSESAILDMVEPLEGDDPALIVVLEDPDLPHRMRSRREELGVSLAAMARRAGVSDQTWRNYESGRTSPRLDKAPRVWAALGWKLDWADSFADVFADIPDQYLPDWAHLLQDGADRGDLLGRAGAGPDTHRLAELADAVGARTAQSMPAWDRDPQAWRNSYSPLLVDTLGVDAARTFALGADVLRDAILENIQEMAVMPRGTHLAELEESALSDSLPMRWEMFYDYDFVFHLYTQAEALCDRLVVHPVSMDEPLVRSVADVVILQRIIHVGAMIAGAQGHDTAPEHMQQWFQALAGTSDLDIINPLFALNYQPGPDEVFHIDHWFDEFDVPFVPDWGAAARAASPRGTGAAPGAQGDGQWDGDGPDATVTEFPRNRRR